MALTPEPVTAVTAAGRRAWSHRLKRAARQPLAVASLAVLLAFAVAALFAPQLAPFEPGATDIRSRLAPPMWLSGGTLAHPLGTDVLGRDLLSRLLYGTRIALIVGFGGVAVSALVGVILGVVAGYFGGRTDSLIMRAVDMLLAIPNILLYLAVLMAFPPSIPLLIAVIGLINWTTFARVVRGEVLAVKQLEYIEAARAAGQRTGWILLRHVLPNVTGPIIVMATVSVAAVIILESSLSFLGFGAQPPAVTWGRVLAEGRNYLATAWWISTFPGACITLLCLALILLGDYLRDALDPRHRA